MKNSSSPRSSIMCGSVAVHKLYKLPLLFTRLIQKGTPHSQGFERGVTSSSTLSTDKGWRTEEATLSWSRLGYSRGPRLSAISVLARSLGGCAELTEGYLPASGSVRISFQRTQQAFPNATLMVYSMGLEGQLLTPETTGNYGHHGWSRDFRSEKRWLKLLQWKETLMERLLYCYLHILEPFVIGKYQLKMGKFLNNGINRLK